MMTFLPRSVVEWAGVKGHNADFIINETRTETLANLNDTGFTFNEIADLIEEQL